MHIQGTITTRPIGVVVCPVCSEYGPCVELSFSKDEDFKQGVTVCTSCLIDPGVSFDVKVPVRTQQPASVKRRMRKQIKREEEQTAKEIRGRTTLASGALFQDGDSSNEQWMIEEKSTKYKSYSIKEEIVTKATAQAARQRKNFVLKVRTATKTLGILLWHDLLPLIREDND